MFSQRCRKPRGLGIQKGCPLTNRELSQCQLSIHWSLLTDCCWLCAQRTPTLACFLAMVSKPLMCAYFESILNVPNQEDANIGQLHPDSMMCLSFLELKKKNFDHIQRIVDWEMNVSLRKIIKSLCQPVFKSNIIWQRCSEHASWPLDSRKGRSKANKD